MDSEIITHRHLLQMESWMLLAAVGKELAGLWAMHTWWGTYIHPGLQAIRAVLLRLLALLTGLHSPPLIGLLPTLFFQV